MGKNGSHPSHPDQERTYQESSLHYVGPPRTHDPHHDEQARIGQTSTRPNHESSTTQTRSQENDPSSNTMEVKQSHETQARTQRRPKKEK